MFGINKKQTRQPKQPLETFDDRAKQFMCSTSVRINPVVLNYLRSYFNNLTNVVNTAYKEGQPLAFYNMLDINNPELKGITWEQALDFSRYDYTVTTVKTLCKYYGYTIWIKEKAGRVFICVSNNKEYVQNFANQIVDSYS